jgi:DeoR/GlpR family transcriptional regulator of sugar metabolism
MMDISEFDTDGQGFVLNKVERRHEQIRSMLLQHNMVTVAEFCKALNCSESTIRNDLRLLERQGLVKRTFGGAVLAQDVPFKSHVNVRAAQNIEAKNEIARYVVDHVLTDGATITLDSGTTNVAIAKKIVESPLENLTVITNSFAAASILTKTDKVRLYFAGGSYDHERACFYDEYTSLYIRTMRSEYFFLSVIGIQADVGLTIGEPNEANIKQVMMSCAAKTIVVADASKVGKVGFKWIAGLDAADRLITNESADPEAVRALEENGLDVVLVPAGPNR